MLGNRLIIMKELGFIIFSSFFVDSIIYTKKGLFLLFHVKGIVLQLNIMYKDSNTRNMLFYIRFDYCKNQFNIQGEKV